MSVTETTWLAVPNVRWVGNASLLAMADLARYLVYPDRARFEFEERPEETAELRHAAESATAAAAAAGTHLPTPRKLMLFLSASCRATWRFITEPACRRLLELSEGHADGVPQCDETRAALWALRSREVMTRAASRAAKDAWGPRPGMGMIDAARAACFAVRRMYLRGADRWARGAGEARTPPWESCPEVIEYVTAAGSRAARAAGHPPYPGGNVGTEQMTWAMQGALRDVFGNPFRPVAFDRAWRTETAVLIARGMYESRDFSAMPILADALQDAGCDEEKILEHCRQPGGHVRGCWVVDLVLGKA
jgi:hypothetical protein